MGAIVPKIADGLPIRNKITTNGHKVTYKWAKRF
jgi:hypothetical protein